VSADESKEAKRVISHSDASRYILQDCVDTAARFRAYATLVHDTVTKASVAHDTVTKKGETEVCSDLLRLFDVVVNFLLTRVGLLLRARQDVHASSEVANWQRFLALSHTSLNHIRGLQEDCRQNLNPQDPHVGPKEVELTTIIYAQTKSIIEEFHRKKLEHIQMVLEHERWERTDVPGEYRNILSQLLGRQQLLSSQDEVMTKKADHLYLHVEGLVFIVVPAALALVQVLNSYVKLCSEIDSLAAEVIQRMGNLLRLFNTKMCQLVLQGQAVKKETLKKVTASNLALSSQCCGLVTAILPRLQENLQTILQREKPHQEQQQLATASAGNASRQLAESMVDDLSKIASEYTNHRNLLFNKLSELLHDRYAAHAKKWLSAAHPQLEADSLAWLLPQEPGTDSDGFEVQLHPHDALRGLAEDIGKMYRALLKNLMIDSVRMIFAKAFEDMASKFDQQLIHVAQEFSTPTPPYEDKLGFTLGDRLVQDVAFLRGELENLNGISMSLGRLLLEMLQHLQTRLPTSDRLKALHPAMLSTLQRAGKLPEATTVVREDV